MTLMERPAMSGSTPVRRACHLSHNTDERGAPQEVVR